jgi:hypothetical protein
VASGNLLFQPLVPRVISSQASTPTEYCDLLPHRPEALTLVYVNGLSEDQKGVLKRR